MGYDLRYDKGLRRVVSELEDLSLLRLTRALAGSFRVFGASCLNFRFEFFGLWERLGSVFSGLGLRIYRVCVRHGLQMPYSKLCRGRGFILFSVDKALSVV